ncbi:MAG: GldG family protein [Lachnospiraceae bacterium]|nr:GldG family protein [Lachnospiraceae bacterium]
MSKKKSGSKIATKGGVYSLIITVIVLAILIVVNVLFKRIPSNATRYDMSASKLYSVTSNTKAVVNTLKQNITIYWIVQAEKEDTIIENLLNRYDDLSELITVQKINPDVYPTFMANYTDEQVSNNSIVVESGSRFRYIPYEDIYITKVTNSYYGTTEQSFDGEGAVTSAIDFVVTDDLPVLYILQGHGEKAIEGEFLDALKKGNIETRTFSLLNLTEVPKEADAVLIYGPESDITESELEVLRDYIYEDGKLLVFSGPTESGTVLENLNALLGDYGVTVEPGIVIEMDSMHYMATQYQAVPYYLMPFVDDTDITASLVKNNYYVIVPIAAALKLDPTVDKEDVTPLLHTSDVAFSKVAGFKMKTYNKEEGDIDGPFTLGLYIKDIHGGRIAWFASSGMLDSAPISYSAGANTDLAMTALNTLVGEREALAIPAKSMSVEQLTITDSAKTTLKILMLAVFPLVLFGAGIIVLLYRRRMQNEKA